MSEHTTKSGGVPAGRAQTTLDFAFGIGVFLLVLAFAFTFVPGMIEPFDAGTATETVGANRVADSLAEGMLGDPATPYVLNTTCTVGFFNASVPPGCSYTGSTVRDRIAFSPTQDVNVTLRGAVSDDQYRRLCWNGTAFGGVGTSDCSGGDLELSTGNAVPSDRQSSVTARRVVSVDGTTAVVRVVMW
jgi:hypothetical protein